MPTCPKCRKRYPDESTTTCADDGEALLPDAAFTGVDADLAAGQTVGEYRIEQKIGEGGFGAVYKSVHPLIGKAAAIKVLNRQYSSNPQMVSRFISEARAVNQIRHRNIIDIFAFGSLEDGRQYFVMELLEGMPLDVYLKEKGRLTPAEAIPILRSIARAIDAAHGAGIAHRDLKPENVFLTFDEDHGIFPKLLDFGIAKLLDTNVTASESPKTRTGTPMGTPYYMSPEQSRGKDVDQRTDIYSLGVMAHELLTGTLPFDGDTMMDLLIKQINAPPPPMSTVTPDIPQALDAPVLQMLEKNPANRPTSLTAAIDELAHIANANGYVVAMPAGAAARLPGRTTGGSSMKSPTDIGSMRTVQATSGPVTSTFLESHSDIPSGDQTTAARARSKMPFIAIGAVVLLGVVGGGFLISKKNSPAIPDTASQPSQPSVAATTSASAASLALAAASASSVPITKVNVTIKAVPEHAAVYAGDDRIGVAPGPIELESGKKVTLTFKADGYKSSDLDVIPAENQPISISLTKNPKHGGGPHSTSPHDANSLENPF
ncbi:MAG: serine/threonine-protein kinase [Polyangiaceae bacterium]